MHHALTKPRTPEVNDLGNHGRSRFAEGALLKSAMPINRAHYYYLHLYHDWHHYPYYKILQAPLEGLIQT